MDFPRPVGDFSMRRAGPGDHESLLHICLRTGDSGEDASAREDDPRLIGLIYALPYQVLEPDFAFMIEGGAGPLGYVLGALDTARFNRRLEAEWFTPLRRTISDPGPYRSRWRGSDWARRYIHAGPTAFPASLSPYPSHAHIDLLPEAQGRGLGGEAMRVLMAALAEAGSPGLHLGVSPENRIARGFYRRLGFAEFRAPDLPEDTTFLVRRLP